MKKILITGCKGQVGWELQRTLSPLGEIIAIDQEHLDLSNENAIRQFIRDLKPTIIVNPAAYTAVDKAESEPDVAMKINGDAPKVLAEEAKKLNSLLIHYSTDYVYSGNSTTPVKEDETPQPLSVYGKTKLAGDQAIQQIHDRHFIFRTSWVYGVRGKNFLLTMLKLAKEKEELKIVHDQIGAPTWSRLIAEATAQVIAHNSDAYGLYHLTSQGKTNWCDFAKTIFALSQKQGHKTPKVLGIPTTEYPLPAKRPFNSLLCNNKIKKELNIALPSWDHALELCLSDLQQA